MRHVAALAAILSIAACGEGGPSREEFVDQANANCKERQKAVLALQDWTEEDFLADPDADWRALDREMREQRRLEPPDELAGDWRRYLRLMDESNRLFRRLQRRDDGWDASQRSVAEGEARKAGVQARQTAKRMGLDVCADAFY